VAAHLFSEVQEFIEAELNEEDTRALSSAPGSSRGSNDPPRSIGTRYRPVLPSHSIGDGLTLAGVALLTRTSERAVRLSSTAAELSRLAVQFGDCTAVLLPA